MNMNIEFYSKCQQCKHLQESIYMTLDNDETLYSYSCKFTAPAGEINCSKFEEK